MDDKRASVRLDAASAPVLDAGEDLWIRGATVVAGPGHVYARGCIILRGSEIVFVGSDENAPTPVGTSRHIDATGWLITPGLINAHTHCPMGFFRGLGHGKSDLIEKFLFPAEKSLTPEILEPLSWSYIYSGLRSGVTCFVDHYYFSAGVARALDRFGLRGAIGETVADCGGAFPSKDAWARARAEIESWPHSSRIIPVVAPHAADTVSPSLLTEMSAWAREQKIPLHMHLSQTEGELRRVQARDGKTPVALAHACGALSERTLAVHLVSASDGDIKLLRDSGATAGFCPASQIIYESLMPVAKLMKAGVPLALGTDCAASNDSADMLQEMRTAAILLRDRGALTGDQCAQGALAMATVNPARVLGLPCGKLEAGLAADLVFLKPDLSTMPMHDPEANLIWSFGSSQVQHVMVDGSWVLWRQRLPSHEEDDLLDAYEEAVTWICNKAGLTRET
jgi:5-methylthioadenosine/S-adenosylhomocysteine deaminase